MDTTKQAVVIGRVNPKNLKTLDPKKNLKRQEQSKSQVKPQPAQAPKAADPRAIRDSNLQTATELAWQKRQVAELKQQVAELKKKNEELSALVTQAAGLLADSGTTTG